MYQQQCYSFGSNAPPFSGQICSIDLCAASDRCRMLGRTTLRTQRDLRQDARLVFWVNFGRHVAGNKARRDRVAGDAAAGKLARDRLGEPDDARLNRQHMRHASPRRA